MSRLTGPRWVATALVAGLVCASGAGARTDEGSTRAAGYRIVGEPLALFASRPDGTPEIRFYVRLNKRLPKHGLMMLDELPAEAPYLASRRSHCYSQEMGGDAVPDSLARPFDGKKAELGIGRANLEQVRELERYVTRTVRLRRVSLRQLVDGDRYVLPRLRRMGCVSPRN